MLLSIRKPVTVIRSINTEGVIVSQLQRTVPHSLLMHYENPTFRTNRGSGLLSYGSTTIQQWIPWSGTDILNCELQRKLYLSKRQKRSTVHATVVESHGFFEQKALHNLSTVSRSTFCRIE